MGRWENSFLHFLYRQHILSIPQLPADLDLSCQTAIVTGSNTGLGYHAAHQLINHRLSTLIMAVRTRAKGIAAATQIRDEFMQDHPDWECPTIKIWELDMSSYDSVLAFAKRVKDEAGHIDIAILNAGVQPNSWRMSQHGHEEAVQVNYLSTALLALSLRQTMDSSYLSALQSKSPPRKQPVLELVGSDSTTFANFPSTELVKAQEKGISLLEALKTHPEQLGLKIDPPSRYANSKLLEHAFFIEFVRRIESESRVVVTLVSPGLCKTELGKYEGITAFVFGAFLAINGRRQDVGARTLTLGATTVGSMDHGTYFSEGAPFPQPDFLESEKGRETAVRLWEEMSSEFSSLSVNVDALMAS